MAKKKKYNYFEAYEEQVDIALKEADLLIEVMENFTTAEAVQEIIPRAHELEHEGDQINHRTYRAVAEDFITPIDREDILEIAAALDDIIDNIEDVIKQFYLMDVHRVQEGALEVARILRQCCEALKVAMHEFVDFKRSKKFRHAIAEVNELEEQADVLHEQMIRALFTEDRENPLRVVIWSRLLVHIEECVDSCEHVSDLMGTVLLKNS